MLKVILMLVMCFSCQTFSEHHCGRPAGYVAPSSATRKDRIVGGYDMGFYKYPWYAALISDKVIGCGGALINSKTVLTAAHCFKTISRTKWENLYVIKLGVYNVCTTENTQAEFKAEKVKIHELYIKKNPYYDIALVTLKEEASQFTPICLPNHSITKRPREGLVPGLGVLKYEGDTPCTVHESRLLIHSDVECKSMLSKVEKNISNIINSFCAGYIQGGIDTCQGDSGGPFQILSDDGRYIVLGVVSFGYKCAAPGVLGLYTDVSKYLDWIRKHSSGSIEHDNKPPDQINVELTTESASSPDETPATVRPPIVATIPMPSVISSATVRPPIVATIPMPSVISSGLKPNQFLQFYPLRPGNARPSALNIFIFNRKNSEKPSTDVSTKNGENSKPKSYFNKNRKRNKPN